MHMEGKHPLILTYGNTLRYHFPLILIIGREPNTDTVSDGSVWFYDFEEYPKCAFWNIAFSVVGRVVGLSRREVKERFKNSNSSPVLFSDAFGQGIKNQITDKESIRTGQLDTVDDQINAIFSHAQLIERVKLVILSGLDSNIYKPFKERIRVLLTVHDIKAIEIPFLYPTNMPSIINKLTTDDIAAIARIYNQYVKEVD